MTVFHYDKTFEGLLTAVFDMYARRMFPEKLLADGEPEPLFATNSHTVITDSAKSSRVWRAVEKKTDPRVCNMLLYAWLSEEDGRDELTIRYIRKIFDTPHGIAYNFADPDVLEQHQMAKKVAREGEHVRQFVRFQKAADGSYFAPIAPKFNALPLAIKYFRDRFADQQWLIYDTRRHYGYYYDLRTVTEVTLEDDAHLIEGKLSDAVIAEDEKLFQEMWQGYFRSLTIKERINPKLQKQHMPQRFWKYLTEKQ